MSKEFTDELFEEFKEQIEHHYLASAISKYDLKLSPMVYAGQDYSNEMGNAYLKMVTKINQKVNKLVKDKYGEDEDKPSSSPSPKKN